ncbi:hypothetical protein Bbelb_303900 [Branchiostoma belcheri]|nr:hypothetical protein Bbelb_303900 [Branchiostoma belcheri]
MLSSVTVRQPAPCSQPALNRAREKSYPKILTFFLAGDLSVFGRLKTHSLAAWPRTLGSLNTELPATPYRCLPPTSELSRQKRSRTVTTNVSVEEANDGWDEQSPLGRSIPPRRHAPALNALGTADLARDLAFQACRRPLAAVAGSGSLVVGLAKRLKKLWDEPGPAAFYLSTGRPGPEKGEISRSIPVVDQPAHRQTPVKDHFLKATETRPRATGPPSRVTTPGPGPQVPWRQAPLSLPYAVKSPTHCCSTQRPRRL